MNIIQNFISGYLPFSSCYQVESEKIQENVYVYKTKSPMEMNYNAAEQVTAEFCKKITPLNIENMLQVHAHSQKKNNVLELAQVQTDCQGTFYCCAFWVDAQKNQFINEILKVDSDRNKFFVCSESESPIYFNNFDQFLNYFLSKSVNKDLNIDIERCILTKSDSSTIEYLVR